MSDDQKPDAIKAPDQIVGRTWADFFFHTKTGPELGAAIAHAIEWPIEESP